MVRHTFESDPDKWSLEAIIHKIGGTVEPQKQPAVSNTHFTKNRSEHLQRKSDDTNKEPQRERRSTRLLSEKVIKPQPNLKTSKLGHKQQDKDKDKKGRLGRQETNSTMYYTYGLGKCRYQRHAWQFTMDL